MKWQQIWHPPALHQGSERKVGWLELFFDLVLVILVAALAHTLDHHVDAKGVTSYLILGVPVFMVWLGHTIYNQRFETNDVSYRLFTFIQMLFIGAMALFMPHAMDTDGPAFALAYAAARGFLILLWVRAGAYVPAARPLTNFYTLGFGISVLLFVISAFVSAEYRIALWVIALFFDIATPLASLRFQHNLPRLDRHKLAERYGLLTIIVLGESLMVTVNNVGKRETIDGQALFMAGASMWITFMIWWLYFDSVARRVPRPIIWTMGIYTYAHFGLILSAMALPAGVFSALSAREEIEPAVRLLGAISLCGTLLFIALLEFLLESRQNYPHRRSILVKLVGATAILVVSLVFAKPDTVLAAQALVLLLVAALNWHPLHFSDATHG